MDKWFQRFSARVESYLFYFTVCFIILLILIQAIMVRGDVRQYLSRVDILEGEPYSYTIKDDEDDRDTPDKQTGTEATVSYFSLTLEVSPPQTQLAILVNGEKKATLYDRPLTITVEAGDLIEVEGEIQGEPAVVRVSDSVGLALPAIGEETIIFGENELIGWAVPEN